MELLQTKDRKDENNSSNDSFNINDGDDNQHW